MLIDDAGARLFVEFLEFERDRLSVERRKCKSRGDYEGAYQCKLQGLTSLEIRDGFWELWERGPAAFDAWVAANRWGWKGQEHAEPAEGASKVVDLSTDPGYDAAYARRCEFDVASLRVDEKTSALDPSKGHLFRWPGFVASLENRGVELTCNPRVEADDVCELCGEPPSHAIHGKRDWS